MRRGIAIIAGAALTLSASAALAHVIDPAVDKANYKLRADIAKQVSKYTFCLVKAASKCEGKGAISGPECNLATGAVAYEMPAGAETAKFQAAIGKCDTKLLLTKKGTDYVGIGCPGDCDSMADGTQPCADLTAFEATVEGTVGDSAKNQLGTLSSVIDFACQTDIGGMNTDQARIDCSTDNAKVLSKYGQGQYKCALKCELDVKAKIGDGGLSNGGECQRGGPFEDPLFKACVDKALAKAVLKLTPSNISITLPAVVAAINDANDGLFNRFDPTSTADASPCGTCGDNTRAGAEECDGTDDAACSGACATDCTCP